MDVINSLRPINENTNTKTPQDFVQQDMENLNNKKIEEKEFTIKKINEEYNKNKISSNLVKMLRAYANEVIIQGDKSGIADDAVSIVIPNATLYIPFAELVDIEKEKERLGKEKERLEGEIKRSNGLLGNERFISKAPAEKVAEERAKLEKYTQMLAQVTERLNSL